MVFRRKRFFRAKRGEAGGEGGSHGRNGKDLIVSVPCGTRVCRDGEELLLGELLEEGQQLVLVRGGRGGKGNLHFVNATNQVPRFGESGGQGQRGRFRLEMRLLADVGLVGLVNVGKSTLLGEATAATPKVGAYAFTTREPRLGVVKIGYEIFVVADIPGLIQGAYAGVGLGYGFLRHIQRARLLLHLVAGDSGTPEQDVQQINEELLQFDPRLAELPQLIVVNKIDLPEVREHVVELEGVLAPLGRPIFFISAATGEGVANLMKQAMEIVKSSRAKDSVGEQKSALHVFRPLPRGERIVQKEEEGKYILGGRGVSDIVVSRDVTDREHAEILRERLRQTGWRRVLKKAGVQPGDIVKVGEIEFPW